MIFFGNLKTGFSYVKTGNLEELLLYFDLNLPKKTPLIFSRIKFQIFLIFFLQSLHGIFLNLDENFLAIHHHKDNLLGDIKITKKKTKQTNWKLVKIELNID